MKIGSKVNFLLGLICQLKILHWQTKKYSKHVVIGEAINNISDNVDEFVEVGMGKYGRFELNEDEKSIPMLNINEIDTKTLLHTVGNALIQFNDDSEESDSDLLGIRDEILSEINKLSYLLTLD
jgi:hypothetical protein